MKTILILFYIVFPILLIIKNNEKSLFYGILFATFPFFVEMMNIKLYLYYKDVFGKINKKMAFILKIYNDFSLISFMYRFILFIFISHLEISIIFKFIFCYLIPPTIFCTIRYFYENKIISILI